MKLIIISQLKTGGTTERHAFKIKEKLNNSLKNGFLNLKLCDISDKILRYIPLVCTKYYRTDLSFLIGLDGASAIIKELETNKTLTNLILE